MALVTNLQTIQKHKNIIEMKHVSVMILQGILKRVWRITYAKEVLLHFISEDSLSWALNLLKKQFNEKNSNINHLVEFFNKD